MSKKNKKVTPEVPELTEEVVIPEPVKKEIRFDVTKYKTVREVVLEKTGELVEREYFNKEYQSKEGKCKLRAAEAFDVPVDHLFESLKVLNNQRVDTIKVNDLIGRYGCLDDEPYNRVDLAKKYNTNVLAVEVAMEKLKGILHSTDVEKAYKEYSKRFVEGIKGKALDKIEKGE